MANPYKQLHTDMKQANSKRGIINYPGETETDRPVAISVKDADGSNQYMGLLENGQIYDLVPTTMGLKGRVGVKSRLLDSDGDGKLSLRELVDNAVLNGFSYPEEPLIETIKVE